MEFLASDALNGRGSGTRDEWIAAAYLGAQARRIGLEPLQAGEDFVQTVDIERLAVVTPPQLITGALHFAHGAHVIFRTLNRTMINGPLVHFHAGTAAPPGSVVLMPQAPPPGASAASAGAVLLLYPAPPPLRDHWDMLARRPLNIGTPRLAGIDRPASAEESSPSQAWLDVDAYAQLAALPERTAVSLQADAQPALGHTWNAVARLPGSDASLPVLLLTAHLDHLGTRDSGSDRIYNGADDDASGCVAVLALAEALQRGPRLRRTVVFAWFGSEEAGGYGARYFVQKPVIPLEGIAANVEFEMIGRPDPAIDAHSLWLTGWERTDLGPTLARHGARLVADPHPKENFFVRSDNIALARRGVVAQTISSFGLHADYHQPSDEVARIDFAHMLEAIRSLYEPLRWLADADFVPHWNTGQQP